MHVLPKFAIYDDEETPDGVFDWGKSRNELFEKYYDASDLYYMGEVEEAKEMLQEIIEQDPYFIDAYNLLGTVEAELGNYKKGSELQQKAMETGQQIIPDDFEGAIRWGFTENRPFLRAMHAVGLNHMAENNYEKTTAIFEQILDYNPNDNQGIRYLIGDLYFLQNQFGKAEKVYSENQNYPPYLYSYGLLHFAMDNHTKAISYFRKGIFENIYISDYLRMKVPLIPYEIWHGTNFEMPETAYDYLDVMIQKWIEFPEAIEMLQFLHVHEQTHAEIQQMYMLKNELYYARSDFESDFTNGFENEDTFDIRDEIIKDINKIKNRITKSSSKKILKKWGDDSKNFRFRQK